jgi:hypothetical protein
MIGKLIEFKVTPELLSVLANFLEYQAQLEPAEIEDTKTSEMLSRFLKRRRAAVRERVNTLLYLIETARVPVVDVEIQDAMARLRSPIPQALIGPDGTFLGSVAANANYQEGALAK